jgi:hypothetical protein
MPKLSGGGINSRVVKRVGIKTGPASSNKISPRGVSQYGYATGSMLTREHSYTTQNSALLVNAGTMPQVPLGNAVPLNVKGWWSRSRKNNSPYRNPNVTRECRWSCSNTRS